MLPPTDSYNDTSGHGYQLIIPILHNSLNVFIRFLSSTNISAPSQWLLLFLSTLCRSHLSISSISEQCLCAICHKKRQIKLKEPQTHTHIQYRLRAKGLQHLPTILMGSLFSALRLESLWLVSRFILILNYTVNTDLWQHLYCVWSTILKYKLINHREGNRKVAL